MRATFATLFGTGLLLLALGIPGVNVYHHVTLPILDNYRITRHYELSLKGKCFISKHMDIRLGTEIKSADYYRDITTCLEEADKGDVITFHLAGYGGDGETLMALISNIQHSKAYIIMSVEAPVYSAHAYLAVFGDELKMSSLSFLMFHRSTIANVDCTQQTGTDRGVSNVIHCMAYKAAMVQAESRLIDTSKVLTPTEKLLLKAGFDVYLQPDDVRGREIKLTIDHSDC